MKRQRKKRNDKKNHGRWRWSLLRLHVIPQTSIDTIVTSTILGYFLFPITRVHMFRTVFFHVVYDILLLDFFGSREPLEPRAARWLRAKRQSREVRGITLGGVG